MLHAGTKEAACLPAGRPRASAGGISAASPLAHRSARLDDIQGSNHPRPALDRYPAECLQPCTCASLPRSADMLGLA